MFVDLNNVTKEIQITQIASTEMSKAVYTKEGTGAYINWVDIKLKQDEVENIASWFFDTQLKGFYFGEDKVRDF